MPELRLVFRKRDLEAMLYLAGEEGIGAPDAAIFEALRAVECVNVLRGDDGGGFATFSLTPKGLAEVEKERAEKAAKTAKPKPEAAAPAAGKK